MDPIKAFIESLNIDLPDAPAGTPEENAGDVAMRRYLTGYRLGAFVRGFLYGLTMLHGDVLEEAPGEEAEPQEA